MSTEILITVSIFGATQLVQFLWVFNKMSIQIKELQIRVHKLEGGEKTTNALLRDLLKEFQDFKVDIAKKH